MATKTISTRSVRPNIPNENPPLCIKFHYTKLLATQPKSPYQRTVKILMNKLTQSLLLLSVAYLFGCSADTSIEVETPAPANQFNKEENSYNFKKYNNYNFDVVMI